ncbi:MAG: lysophospholipid acyltransferase family protein [Gammaproteobacteria bacterium]|nr:lysophospholipid acyltransferase family protein [Gammaproteobacteria bacterium]
MKISLFVIRALLFLIHLTLGMLIAGLLFHLRNRNYHQHKVVIRQWLKLCALIFGCRIQVSSDNRQALTDIEGSLIVANHISWLDILVLGGLFNVRFLSKSEIRGWPFVGWLSAASGTLFIERGRGSEISNTLITEALRQGDNVLIFPEGTTTDGVSVKPFHPRLFKSAISAQKPVTPVMISYLHRHQPNTGIAWDDDTSFMTTLWHIIGSWRTDVQVHCFAEQSSAVESRKELAKRCHQQIQQRLEAEIY